MCREGMLGKEVDVGISGIPVIAISKKIFKDIQMIKISYSCESVHIHYRL